MNKLRKSHEQVMNKLGRSHEQVITSHKQVVKKLLMSHEQVPTVVIIRLETGETTITGVWCCMVYGVWCMVVPHSCDNKTISAPSWGWLAGLG